MNISDQRIILTEDGSHSLFVASIDESYHSTHGAAQESTHIFIENGLANLPNKTLNVLELGFGTGLNAALTLAFAQKKGLKINYTTLEKFPLKSELYQTLNYAEMCGISHELFLALHQSQWGTWEQITPYFNLRKINGDIETWLEENSYHMIFFDAFSPDKQPELWRKTVFDNMYKSAKQGALLTTYWR